MGMGLALDPRNAGVDEWSACDVSSWSGIQEARKESIEKKVKKYI